MFDDDSVYEDGYDIGFCPRCGDQLDGSTPPSDVVCWRCGGDDAEDLD